MSALLVIFICIVLFMLASTALVFVIGPSMVLTPKRRGSDFYCNRKLPISPADLGLAYDIFSFTASDHYSALSAWFIPAENPKGTIIYLHGVGDNKMSGLLLAKVFHDHHFNVMLYDSRVHGESSGQFCTYGFHEKYDVQRAVDMLKVFDDQKKYFIGKIGVFGTSMGAAIALQAAAIEPRISAVVSEASFATLRQITVDYQKRLLRLPWHFLRNIAMKKSERIALFKHREVSPIHAVKNIHVPVFFIHGKNDAFIKYEYSQQLYAEANEPKEIWLVDGANHSNVHDIGKTEYEEKLLRFFDKRLV
jgi:uncharacterized protein